MPAKYTQSRRIAATAYPSAITASAMAATNSIASMFDMDFSPATKASRQCGEGAVSSCLITTPKCMSVGVDAFHRPMWLNDNTDMKSRE